MPVTRPGRWVWSVLGLTLLGLVIRLAALWHAPPVLFVSDPGAYHLEANQLVDGLGWIKPYSYVFNHLRIPSAYYPPLFPLVLAASSVVGAHSFLAHQVWCCVIGASAVPLGAYTGRRIANPRTGLIVAGLIAVYPNLWMSDPLVFSEALSPTLILVVLLCAYRFWQQPATGRVLVLGGAIALAALARDELGALPLLLLLPLTLTAAGRSWGQRLALLLLGGAAVVVVSGPWIGYNLSRFHRPVLVSTGLGTTLAFGNCDPLYHGPLTGSYSFTCGARVPIDPHADESVQAAQYQRVALRYASQHRAALPRVLEARVGRTFGFYHPLDQVRIDVFLDRRPRHWAYVGLAMYYALVPLSVVGAVVLRRRGVPILPLLAMGVVVVLAVAISWGQTRFRTDFEVSLVLLAAVGVDAVWPERGRGSHVAR